ncbi:MAG: MMPL family transporter, partial [Bacteroidetes bacterium]|nr:MMPL family transporter [Bacteroidota bacterium]
MSSWSRLAHWILGHRLGIVLVVVLGTVVLGYWAAQVKTDHSPGQFIASDSQVKQDFERVNALFGESQTILYVVFAGVAPHDTAFLEELDRLVQDIREETGVEDVLALTNVPYLVRDSTGLRPKPLYDPALSADSLRQRIEAQPFLRGLLLSNDGRSTVMLVDIDRAFNNTAARVDLVTRVAAQAEALPGNAAFAGFPYLRTQYAQRVTREAPLFTVLALLISLVFLYVTFRNVRAVVLPTLVVALGIVWTIGLIALFDHRLNIVSSILPALLVIIGMASAIHLSTKYFDQYRLRGDQREALIHTIRTVGLSTFLACLTTAIGFGVLLLSGSKLLAVFGEFAAVGILILYGLSITLIPLAFVSTSPPRGRGPSLAASPRLTRLLGRLAGVTQRRGPLILGGAVLLMLAGILGTTRISTDIFVFSDFYRDDPLRQDLAVFEDNY